MSPFLHVYKKKGVDIGLKWDHHLMVISLRLRVASVTARKARKLRPFIKSSCCSIMEDVRRCSHSGGALEDLIDLWKQSSGSE